MRHDYSSLRRGLVGAWCPSLGATGYTLLDRSGRNNHGTLTNMGGQDNWISSGGAGALQFDGTNDYVDLSSANSSFLSLTAITVSAWVRFLRLNNTFQLFVTSDGGGFGVAGATFALNNSNQVYCTFGNGFSAYSGVSTGTWYHLCMPFVILSGATPAMAINGVFASPASSGTWNGSGNTSHVLRLGSRSAGTASFSQVLLDDVRIYSRALTLQEIRLLASRRGIGLTPVRQRRTSASSRRLYQNVAGTWKETLPLVNDGGTWKEGAVYENVGGVWKN